LLSFDAVELVDAADLMPTFLRKMFELFLESTSDTTCTLDTLVSPSTDAALKASIFDCNSKEPAFIHTYIALK
jgi:hypothetical protein